MALHADERLGPYQILGELGAGGMGEVYRARDPRLGRAVAVKVLRPEAAHDPDRLRRFEQEARAAGGLNHPNILAVYDVGSHEGAPYLVTELLEGETLRTVLARGSLPLRKAVEYAQQVARGLGAAHEKGIVHRDLKPANVFVTKDGRVKILDFGLVKLTQPDPAPVGSRAATATDEGMVMGTVGYMSPEQVRGQAVDSRSDIFALGALVYETLSGRRAFSGDTPADTMTAILTKDPEELVQPGSDVPVSLERIVRRCLEKDPGERFQSAKDVAFALEAESGTSRSAPVIAAVMARPRSRWLWATAVGLSLVAAGGIGLLYGRRLWDRAIPKITQLTFRRGIVGNARFASDGQTVVYSARWEGKPSEVFTARLDLAEAQALSLAQGARLRAQHGGEALIGYEDGRLARMPLVGGTPRDVAENTDGSDWSPTGDIAIIRSQFVPKDRSWLEYPIGKTLLESPADRPLWEPRVSPGGDRVALIVGTSGARGGDVVVVDGSGHQTVLSSGWMDVSGLAWSPDGREVWFTAGGPARGGVSSWGTLKELHAVTLTGRERLLLRMAGDLTLRDVSRDGRALLSHGRTRSESRGKLAGDEKERDLTYLDGTQAAGMSADGRALLFAECAQAGGPRNTVYLKRVGDSNPIRLGEGAAMALSPDGRRAIALNGSTFQSGGRLMLLSAGVEPPRELPRGTVDAIGWAWWTPDGQRVLFNGKEEGRNWRTYAQEPPDGQPQPISPEAIECKTPGSVWTACFQFQEDEGRPVRIWQLRSLDGVETRPAPWIGRDEAVVAWSPDGRHAFVGGFTQPPFRVFRVEVATGRREPWLDTSPPDPAGVDSIAWVGAALTPDGRYYAYSYLRTLSDLFLVEGLR